MNEIGAKAIQEALMGISNIATKKLFKRNKLLDTNLHNFLGKKAMLLLDI
jgi:hypothetical protein